MGQAARPGFGRPFRLRRPARPTLRQLRLGSGLVLFAYVLTHLLVHALGNVSLDALETGLTVKVALWRTPPALLLLYGALLIHLVLGLYAFYERRFYRVRPAETAQLLLGLAVPLLLVSHVVGTRLAWSLEGLDRGYAQVLYATWVAAPGQGMMQAAGLVVAWLHGCFGLYFWLRLKRGFPGAAPWLLAGAVLVPVLALLGVVQGGRSVALLAADPAWRAEELGANHLGGAAQGERLSAVRRGLFSTYMAALALVVLARGARTFAETRGGFVRIGYPDGRTVRVPRGSSVLEASRRGRIPHASVCGGRGRCSTCRIRVVDPERSRHLPEPERAERLVLERIGASPGIRLACQLRPDGDLTVAPLFTPQARARSVPDAERAATGEERFVVVLFADLRGSTRFAEEHLPYDTVFVIGRFLGAVGRAVREAGGSVNQHLGDGLMAIFGLDRDPKHAARAALKAVDGIAVQVEQLNRMLAADLGERLRYGVGLHAGLAIVGELGDETESRFTVLGDTVNVAARLEGLTGPMRQVAIVSEAVYEAAGLPPGALQELTLTGRARPLRAHLIGADAPAALQEG
ncbi:adenylate/guanylate cyclase [Methylorubrum populi BJ001]|uniref:Adenylate/guanylate cyclase n=1 Tax=Methylorubrum populi (strain ATCC BAA-705 / NCIMB 13946 / BJ001) TaxID=441620 RepID=B1ZIM2_METPB|nr:adenylate/guanylate cyclase domain-containing protein [Methylorubrum populi]ACB81429.1 adenylate/guanylate cyclase [Methylorubrum populi BJ001]OAH34654.1 adenylate cyclase [Methylorubrum populi]PZP72429.1 MAG: adenylate/guanylate cyclase domain-containing protein [Methylorubrum populi]